MLGKCEHDTEMVTISRSERHGLVWGFVFGASLVVFIGLLGSDIFINSSLAQDQLPWLVNADEYYRKDVTIPLGAVTVVIIAMLHLERKPKLELSLGALQAVASVVIAMVASGLINLTFAEIWISAAIILSPAIIYICIEQISRRCFGS